MTARALLLASTLAVIVFASDAAYAGVKFISVAAGAGASADAWNGIAENPKTDSKTKTADTTKLKKAKQGIAALPSASVSSGGNRNASADDAETAVVTLATKFDADLFFSGTTDASVTSNAGSGAYADAGGGQSYAYYQFRVTSPEQLNIAYETVSNFLTTDPAYELAVLKGKNNPNPIETYFIDPNADDSIIPLELTKGFYTVVVYLDQPDSISAGIGDSLSRLYHGDFHVTLSAAVPEPATWVMMLSGLGALGVLAARRRKGAAPA